MGESILHAIEIFIGAILAFFFAVIGTLARLLHEQAHGTPLTWSRMLYALPSALIMGVVGHAIGEYLVSSYQFPEATGGALGGVLGYLGPTVINEGFRVLLAKFKKGNSDEGS